MLLADTNEKKHNLFQFYIHLNIFSMFSEFWMKCEINVSKLKTFWCCWLCDIWNAQVRFM